MKDAIGKIDESIIRKWVIDLVIDKSFWGLKIQEAILIKIEKLTGIKCRLTNKEEEQKGIGCCPYELAIPKLEIGKNKWLDMIRMGKA